MFRKTFLTLAASAALGVAALAPTSAGATWYGHGYHYAPYPIYYGKSYHYAPWYGYGPRFFRPRFRFGGWKHFRYHW